MNNLMIDEQGTRVLTVIYKLSRGIVGIAIRKDELFQQVAKDGVLEMSQSDFDVYKNAVLNQHRQTALN
jgi:hypothetical protein